MESILNWLGPKVSGLLVGMAIPLIFIALKKFIPKFIGKIFTKNLEKTFGNIDAIQNPKRKAIMLKIVLGFVELAEYELPDKGMGKERYNLVAEKICKIFPFFQNYKEKLAEIIEESVRIMDEELKKRIQ